MTAHLAAGFANYDERNNDYETICQGLRFQRNRSIEDHDAIIWLGDFNYRIGLPNQTVRDLVQRANYEKLYDNDQVRRIPQAFILLTNTRFSSTYKCSRVGHSSSITRDWLHFRLHTSMTLAKTLMTVRKYGRLGPLPSKKNYLIFSFRDKARIPAWCDRILWKGSDIRQLNYDVSNLRLSDHRPVWASFTCTIIVVDEARKQNLRRSLHVQRRRNSQILETQPESLRMCRENLIPLEPIPTELPPPSSDHRKWWLDNGQYYACRSCLVTSSSNLIDGF